MMADAFMSPSRIVDAATRAALEARLQGYDPLLENTSQGFSVDGDMGPSESQLEILRAQAAASTAVDEADGGASNPVGGGESESGKKRLRKPEHPSKKIVYEEDAASRRGGKRSRGSGGVGGGSGNTRDGPNVGDEDGSNSGLPAGNSMPTAPSASGPASPSGVQQVLLSIPSEEYAVPAAGTQPDRTHSPVLTAGLGLGARTPPHSSAAAAGLGSAPGGDGVPATTTIGFGASAPRAPSPAQIVRTAAAAAGSPPGVAPIASTAAPSPPALGSQPAGGAVAPSASGTAAAAAASSAPSARKPSANSTITSYFRQPAQVTAAATSESQALSSSTAAAAGSSPTALVGPSSSSSSGAAALRQAPSANNNNNSSASSGAGGRAGKMYTESQAAEVVQTATARLAAARDDAVAEVSRLRQETEALRASVEQERATTAEERERREEEKRGAARNLAGLLREMMVSQTALHRRNVADQQRRLGRMVVTRVTSQQVNESWEDGEEFLELVTKEAKLKAEKAELERLTKEVKKRNKERRGEGAGGRKSAAAAGGKRKGGRAAAAADGGSDDEDEDGGEDPGTNNSSMLGDTSDLLRTGALAHLGLASAASGRAGGSMGPPAPVGSAAALSRGAGAGASSSSASASSLLSSSSSALGGSGSSLLDAHAELELVEAEETLRQALVALKREEVVLAERRRALELEKTVLIAELRRQRNENASRWRSNVTLEGERYLLLELLGKGGFCEVWRAMDLHTVTEVAVKIHQLGSHWPEEKKVNYVKHAVREYKIQRDLDHPHIVRLHAVIEIDSSAFATVLEYCRGSDLDRVLKHQYAGQPMGEREARAIIIQVLTALRYLNGYNSHFDGNGGGGAGASSSSSGSSSSSSSASSGAGAGAGSMPPPPPRRKIIHYDLKPANILFDEFRSVKLTDFGLSKIVDDDGDGGATSLELTSQGAGTYWYLPPETFFQGANVRISNKVDVWSVGVIMYQMLYAKRPFGEGMGQEQMLQQGTILQQARDGPMFPPKPPVSDAAKRFIQRCLTFDQAQRPDIFGICEDPYLRVNMR